MSERVKNALAAQRQATKQLCEALAADYPRGAGIVWKAPSGRTYSGTVQELYVQWSGFSNRLAVRNNKTGKTVIIRASYIL